MLSFIERLTDRYVGYVLVHMERNLANFRNLPILSKHSDLLHIILTGYKKEEDLIGVIIYMCTVSEIVVFSY